jgi:DnaJ-class molecular chaperone
VTCRYHRLRNDLIYRHKITLQEAIKCQPVKIPLLDGRTILLAIDQVITPKTIKKIEGEGMKIFDKKDYMDKNCKRGDLYVQFEIVFPRMLNNAQREKINAILNN